MKNVSESFDKVGSFLKSKFKDINKSSEKKNTEENKEMDKGNNQKQEAEQKTEVLNKMGSFLKSKFSDMKQIIDGKEENKMQDSVFKESRDVA